MKESVDLLEKESKALSPFKTGELEGNTETKVTGDRRGITGEVRFNVEYATIRHNRLDTRPGPGTASKSPTKYGTPGSNYLQNPGRGMGTDRTYHKIIDKEVKKIK